jgi:flagellar biogenesis protein FliO
MHAARAVVGPPRIGELMSADLFASVTSLLSALALVLGVFLVGLYLAASLRGRRQRGGWIRILAASDLGGKRTIAVVEVVDEVLVLGIAPQQISLLSKIEAPEAIQRLKSAVPSPPALPFLSYLERLTAKMTASTNAKESTHA